MVISYDRLCSLLKILSFYYNVWKLSGPIFCKPNIAIASFLLVQMDRNRTILPLHTMQLECISGSLFKTQRFSTFVYT
jgi:hypothetical protein